MPLEHAARDAARAEADLDAAAAELERLRPLEAAQPYPGTLGEALSDAVRLLGWLLCEHRPGLVFDKSSPQRASGRARRPPAS